MNYKIILDQIFDGVYIVDRERRIIYWNDGAKRISGFKSEEVVGRYCHDNILNHVDEFGINLCLNGCPLHQTLADGHVREIMVYLQHKRGHRIPVKIRSFPLYEDGEIVASVEIFTESFERSIKPKSMLVGAFKDTVKDELTGLPNRRMIDHYLNSKMNDYRDLGIPFGVVMIDIDSFEEFNNILEDIFSFEYLFKIALNKIIPKIFEEPIPLIVINSDFSASNTPLIFLNFLMASFAICLQSLRGVPKVNNNSITS